MIFRVFVALFVGDEIGAEPQRRRKIVCAPC
jgi:hypothetical protein